MSEMIDKVAKALGEIDFHSGIGDWNEMTTHMYWREVARVALRAMREPTQAMKDCPLRYLSADLDYDEMYRKMIDAALQEPGSVL